MTKEVLKSFKAIGDRLEDLNRRICDMTGGMHKDSTDSIATNADAIAEVGDTVATNGATTTDNADALAELGDQLAELQEKVAALEGSTK